MSDTSTTPAPCPKCNGRGFYHIDELHGELCSACCPHDQGWSQLGDLYDHLAGRWCCRAGCGALLPAGESPKGDER